RRHLQLAGLRQSKHASRGTRQRAGDHHGKGDLDARRPEVACAHESVRIYRSAAGQRLMNQEAASMQEIHNQIMWNRLISVVEEQARIMIRTAFSTTVREAGDLSAGIFDLRGRMMAQAVTGTPGHVNSMAESVAHYLRKYPAETMAPGDHYITNDPWFGTGHLHDLTDVTPAFYRGRIVGLFANTAHVIDIGGLGMGPDGRSVFE